MTPSPPSAPPRNAIVPVATPAMSLQLGWVQVGGMWGTVGAPDLAKWRARRTAQVRWRPQAAARRQEWKVQEP